MSNGSSRGSQDRKKRDAKSSLKNTTSPYKYLKETYASRTMHCLRDKENKVQAKTSLLTKKKQRLSLNNWRVGTECPEKHE